MTPDDVAKLANDANVMFIRTGVPGYLGTRVHNYDPPILAHQFASYLEAERFQGAQSLIAGRGYFVDPQNAEVVLQRLAICDGRD